MVEVVFFDVGNTLVYASPSVPEMFAKVARERGHALTVRDVEPHMALADAYYESEYLRDGDFWCSHERSVEVWKTMYRILSEQTGLSHDARGMADAVYDRYLSGDAWGIYQDVIPCLRTLKRSGRRLAVISNWDATLESLLRNVGLLPYFDEVLCSASEGYRKPSPVMYELALERMGVSASQAAHVGDLPEADGAAAAVDITPVIIDRKGRYEGCGFRRINTLTDLPAEIEGM